MIIRKIKFISRSLNLSQPTNDFKFIYFGSDSEINFLNRRTFKITERTFET